MWSNSELKVNAKESLRRCYWMSFLVTLIPVLIQGAISRATQFANPASNQMNARSYSNPYNPFAGMSSAELFAMLSVIAVSLFIFCIIVTVIQYAINVFLTGPIMAGQNRYFMLARAYDKVSFTVLFSQFKQGRFLGTAKAIWAKLWRVSLWSLLLVIPGIIKSYQYFFVEYLILENPDLDPRRVLEISKAMTDGQKWNIFVLQLSFIGWYLLGFLFCCVGWIFVLPYYEATKAELYACMRQYAISSGITSEMELLGFELEA